jgi:hypothetical protein
MYRERHAELRAEAERRGMGAAGPVLHRVRIVTDYDLDDFGRCPGCQRQVERTLRVPGSVFGAPNREIPMGGPFVPDPLSPDEAKAWNEYTAKLEHEQSTRAVAHARAEAAERPAAVRAPRPAANEAADVEPAAPQPAPAVVVSVQPERVQRMTGASLIDPRNPTGPPNRDFWN